MFKLLREEKLEGTISPVERSVCLNSSRGGNLDGTSSSMELARCESTIRQKSRWFKIPVGESLMVQNTLM